MSIASLAEIREVLEDTEDNLEKLEILMDYGRELESFPENQRIEENKVSGCISEAFISAEVKDGKIYYKGDSDALVVKAYIAILIKALSGLEPKEILDKATDEVRDFLKTTNIKANLTPSRANAFENVFEIMKLKAKQNEN